MHSVRTSALVAALLASLAGTAWAQAANPPAATQEAAPQRKDSARWQERFQRRMGELKQQLQLSPGQEGAWNDFIEQMQPRPGERLRIDREQMARLTTPERIDRLRALRDQRNAEMDRRAEATKAFYATLTPEQKKSFDDLTARRLQHGHGHGHRGGHHHQGG